VPELARYWCVKSNLSSEKVFTLATKISSAQISKTIFDLTFVVAPLFCAAPWPRLSFYNSGPNHVVFPQSLSFLPASLPFSTFPSITQASV